MNKFDPTASISVKGATAPSGAPYVRISACGSSAWLPLAMFRRGGGAAEEALAGRNIVLLGDEWKACKTKVLKIKKFPSRALVEHPGWRVSYFALSDGSVIGGPTKAKRAPVVLFSRTRGRCATRGTLDDWLQHVAAPLRGQQLAQFILMAMFAAPLLRLINRAGNFGFELSGPKGVGKSTLQFLASSVAGPALSRSGVNYWRSANATAAGLEGVMAEHADMPLIIEETNLFAAGEGDRTRSAKLNELVFRLADGSVKARHHDHGQKRFRFVYITSTNEPLEQILGTHRATVSDAAADRLMTLPVGDERPHGIFDFVPKAHPNAAEFADTLAQAASRYHGTAMRAFLEALIAARQADANGLRRTIQRSVRKFRAAVGVNTNSGSERRVADAFGLVYAAGKLAKSFGALPPNWNCLKGARTAYELNRSAAAGIGWRARVIRLSRAKGVLDLSEGLTRLSDDELSDVPAFKAVGRSGRRELLLTPSALEKAFADRRSLFRDAEIKRMMVTDADHMTVKRKLRAAHEPERVYCFKLPGKRSARVLSGRCRQTPVRASG